MIKLLHSADWHMDAPLAARTAEQAQLLRSQMLALPGRICALARKEGCRLMLLSCDIFDGAYTAEGFRTVRDALADVKIPVFIAPGNHDPYCKDSPWVREQWPENVHIFSSTEPSCVRLAELDCSVYGAAFDDAYCGSLLENFRAEGQEQYALGVMHGDPVTPASLYNPVTKTQIMDSGLDYLALGHIHGTDSFVSGGCTVAWPGCPMGHGYDETGKKGVLIVELDQTVKTRFCPVEGIGFYSYRIEAGFDPLGAAEGVLPALGGGDFYRITFAGEAALLDLKKLKESLSRFPNLELVDETVRPVDLWENAGEDSLEGVFFRILQEASQNADDETREKLELAARISRKILSGQEVKLP